MVQELNTEYKTKCICTFQIVNPAVSYGTNRENEIRMSKNAVMFSEAFKMILKGYNIITEVIPV